MRWLVFVNEQIIKETQELERRAKRRDTQEDILIYAAAPSLRLIKCAAQRRHLSISFRQANKYTLE